ncbi:MAG: hypothetical protein JWO25_2855 [Alphaproteobacteria bacterium]|nr:hypothetical protein [Alphaproteobacteria bacterium]
MRLRAFVPLAGAPTRVPSWTCLQVNKKGAARATPLKTWCGTEGRAAQLAVVTPTKDDKGRSAPFTPSITPESPVITLLTMPML